MPDFCNSIFVADLLSSLLSRHNFYYIQTASFNALGIETKSPERSDKYCTKLKVGN